MSSSHPQAARSAMTDAEALEAIAAQALCHKCVGEPYLAAEMKAQGRVRRCCSCHKRRHGYTLGALAERIDDVFRVHFRRTSDEPDDWQRMAMADKESTYDWERAGEPVVWAIANAADIPYEAAHDIQRILADKYADIELAKSGVETRFHRESYYEESATDDLGWQEGWGRFEQTLRTRARFFSTSLSDYLRAVFRDLDRMTGVGGRPLLIEIGPGTPVKALYRARVFQSDPPLVEALARPDLHLGPPPAHLAAAGRMNARGIAVFYGATAARVAIAEVRPPVGSQVAVARFRLLRRLRVLDLTALGRVSEAGSLFDPGLADRLARAKFLRSLSGRMTRPVMPDDEALDYLPTQAVADFLAGENTPRLDGILFPSVQAGTRGPKNVVLFHHAAEVEELQFPPGTQVEARTGDVYEEGWVQEYSVIERTPPPWPDRRASRPKRDWSNIPTNLGGAMALELREPTLRVDADATKVHRIQAVRFSTEKFDVRRWRWELTAQEQALFDGEDEPDLPF